METCKRILSKLLYPHPVVTFLLTVLSAAGLIYVFANGMDDHPVAYGAYVLSFYTLCVWVAALPPVIRGGRKRLYGNAHAARYLGERELRMRVALYNGTAINLAYALFKLGAGIWFRSFWFGAVAVYYMVLCLIRFLLVRGDRTTRRMEAGEDRELRAWRSYRTCGWLLLVLNLTMTGVVFQMIWQNKSYAYPGFVIYAAAAYTFYRLTMAVIRTVKMRKGKEPVLAAAKAIDLSVALMAIFALQTAMFASFGSDMSADARLIMNAATGTAVCFGVVCIALFMVLRSGKAIKEMEINKTQTEQQQNGNIPTV